MQIPIDVIQRTVTYQDVLDCFYLGSLDAYVGGGEYEDVSDILGMKQYIYSVQLPETNATLWFSDAYGSTGPESGGQTIISLLMPDFDPTWLFLMQYEGRELVGDKAIIGLLKEALRANYSQKIFRGGRGPEEYTSPNFPGLIYSNKLEIPEGFGWSSVTQWFKGFELIRNLSGETQFYHNITGKMLVGLPSR